jgi:SAM-dependent methyltransferase
MSSPEQYVPRNVAVWSGDEEYLFESGRRAWASEEPFWGVWHVPERNLRVLPELGGKDVVDLGCGTGYWCAWFARAGARVVGVDPTPAQLERARRLQTEFGLEFELIAAAAEDVPLRDAAFDLVFSEYGAAIWADPYRWIPEAARLLRPGGELIFLRNSTLVILCSPAGDVPAGQSLQRPQFGLHRVDEWDGVEFHLPHGEWIRLLRANGFEIEDLVELQAPPEAETHPHYGYVTADWGRRWPAEEIWKARKASR